jgi:hypothetical protein
LYFKVVATDNSCGFTGESTTATYAAPVAPIVAASMFADCDQVTVNYSANAANAVMIYTVSVKKRDSNGSNRRETFEKYCKNDNSGTCLISFESLRKSPYNLIDNDLVEVEVSGYSQTVGESFISNVVILTQSQSNQVIRLL